MCKLCSACLSEKFLECPRAYLTESTGSQDRKKKAEANKNHTSSQITFTEGYESNSVGLLPVCLGV